MGTNEGTVVTLNTLGSSPVRNSNGSSALFVGGSTQFELTVCIVNEGRNRQVVTVHQVYSIHDAFNHLNGLSFTLQYNLLGGVCCICPVSRNSYFMDSVASSINSLAVHVYNILTLAAELCYNLFLHVVNSFFCRQYVCQLEECRLKNGTGALAQSDFGGNLNGINGVYLDVVLSDVPLCIGMEVLTQLLVRPLAVNQELSAGLNVLNHLVSLDDVGLVVTGHQVSLANIVGTANRLVSKAQVGNGNTTSLLGVVLEVGLDILVGVVTDNLCGVFVSTNSSVTTDTPEFTFNSSFSRGDRSGLNFRQAEVGNIVHDTNCEASLGSILLQFLEDSEYAGRRRILGAQAVAATNQYDVVEGSFAQCSSNVQVQRLTQRTGLLGSVENSKLLYSLRQNLQEGLGNPRTIEANLNQTNLLSTGVQVVDYLFCNVTDGAHSHDYTVGIGSTIVVEQVIVCTQLGINLCHVLAYYFGQCVVNRVTSLTMLKEDISVFVRTAHCRMVGVQRVSTECLQSIHVHHVFKVCIVPSLNLLDFVGCAESVKKVQERNAAFQCCQVGNRSQVHDFLCIGFCQHSKTSLTTGVYVGMITENTQSLRGNGSGRDVEYTRQLLTGNLIHVRNHQQETLRCSKCGGHGTSSQ